MYSNAHKVAVKVVYVSRGGQYNGFITISGVTFCNTILTVKDVLAYYIYGLYCGCHHMQLEDLNIYSLNGSYIQ